MPGLEGGNVKIRSNVENRAGYLADATSRKSELSARSQAMQAISRFSKLPRGQAEKPCRS